MRIPKQFAGATLAFGLIAGCSGPETEPQARQIPHSTSSATVYEHPNCLEIENTQALGSFVMNVLSYEDDYDSSMTDVLYFTEDHSDLSPQQLVDAYIAERTLETGQEVEFAFDKGIIPTDWTYTDEDGEPASDFDLSSQKQVLIGKVDNVLRALGEYPPEILADLNIKSIRVADQYERYGGHYDHAHGEVLIEYDAFGNSGISLGELRKIFAHEILGHGAHVIVCQNFIGADRELSELNGDFDYIGHGNGDSASNEEVAAEYAKIPSRLLEYGPERTFAREYGASTVAEDFATIVEFTLESHGLIQPGDADFGSPLQRKQQIVVDRLDNLLPGFRAYAENRTVDLRRNPSHEALIESARDLVVPPELLPNPDTYDPLDSLDYEQFRSQEMVPVLNGAFYESFEKERGGMLYKYPAVYLDPKGKVTRVLYKTEKISGSMPIREGQAFRFFEGELEGGDIVLMPKAEYERITTGMPALSPEAAEFYDRDPGIVVSQ